MLIDGMRKFVQSTNTPGRVLVTASVVLLLSSVVRAQQDPTQYARYDAAANLQAAQAAPAAGANDNSPAYYAGTGNSAQPYYYYYYEDANAYAAAANATAYDNTPAYYYYYDPSAGGFSATGGAAAASEAAASPDAAQTESAYVSAYPSFNQGRNGNAASWGSATYAYYVVGEDGNMYPYYGEATADAQAGSACASGAQATDAAYAESNQTDESPDAALASYYYPSNGNGYGNWNGYGGAYQGYANQYSSAYGQGWNPYYSAYTQEAQDEPPMLPDEQNQPADGDQQDQTFGEEPPPPDNNLQFLRVQSVLLEPGEHRLDIGWNYAISEAQVPIVVDLGGGNVAVTRGRIRQRLMLTPLELRYGWTEKVQLFANVPFGWANSEVAFGGIFDEFTNRAGIGDVSGGATILLHRGDGRHPDVTGTVSFTAPTGQSTFPILGFSPNSRLGEGFWAVSASFVVIHRHDPVVVFYGGGYRHRFDHEFDGSILVDPGEQIFYQFGVGFAANERVTLSASFLGLYITEDFVNGQRVQGGISEPMRMRFAATMAQESTFCPGMKIIEPFAEIGMTDDSAGARIGITFTF